MFSFRIPMSRQLILALLLTSGIHPNPGPTNAKTIYSQPFTQGPNSASHQASFTAGCRRHLPRNPTSGQASSGSSLASVSSQATLAPSQASPISSQASSGSSDTSQATPSSSRATSNSSQTILCTSAPSQAFSSSQSTSATSVSSQTLSSHSFLQFNCNGVKNSLTEINSFLHQHKVKIACLQETRLSAKDKDPSFLNYSLLRKERPVGNGGGLAILIHHSVGFSQIDTSAITQGDNVIELLGITATINGSPINIFNIYLPPASSCPRLYKPNFTSLLDFSDSDTVILGDVNAHNGAWFATSACDRGDSLASAIENSALCILNTDSPTRLPIHGSPNSPDLSLISAHLAATSIWSTHIGLNSDHLPITIDLGGDSPPARASRTYTNFRLAKWKDFIAETELRFATLPPPESCATDEQTFREILLTAAGHSIPAGHRKEYTPGLPRAAVPLVGRRDELRRLDPHDPEISDLNDEITSVICESSRKSWVEKVESCSLNSNSTRYWSLLRNLSGKRARQPPNQPITFGNKVLTKNPSIAKRFNKQFSSVSSHKQNPQTRRVMRNLKHKHQIDPEFTPFTEAATKDAINQASNSTAGLTSLHFKHLGLRGVAYLTKLFNLSLSQANLPVIWKTAHIIPIPKPGKPLNLSTSYRPISLLSPAVKILERLLLPFINPPTLPLSSTQHGFRPFRSTTSALLPLVTTAANGFNVRKPPTRTAVVAVDISKAFDAVDHTLLLKQISDSDLNSNVVRWLAVYLRGRSSKCLFRSSVSPSLIIHSGVPQGSVLSLLLSLTILFPTSPLRLL